MVRISDVAKHAGVSVASVSRVLGGQPGVGAEVKARILESVRVLGYRPDLAARRLRSRRTDTIGLIVSDIRNPFFTEISRAVEDVAFQSGRRVILCNTDEDPAREALCLDLMRDENVSGVILSPTMPLLTSFRACDYPFPVVFVDRCVAETDADVVVLDNHDAASRLTKHLIDAGYSRCMFLYGDKSATGRQRFEGYRSAMLAHDLTPLAEALPPNAEQACRAVAELLHKKRLPEALIASSGLILLGITEAVREAGLVVPDQVAVAGFDDLPWTRLVTPSITVVAQPTYEIGSAAIDLLLRRIQGGDLAQRQIVLRGQLTARESTRPRSASGRPVLA